MFLLPQSAQQYGNPRCSPVRVSIRTRRRTAVFTRVARLPAVEPLLDRVVYR